MGIRLLAAHQLRSRLATARAYLDRGDAASASYVLRPLLEKKRRDEELLYLAARSFRLLGAPEKSLEYATIATELGYQSVELDAERGLALFELGRFQEAEPILKASPTKESMAALTMLHLELFEMDQVLNDLDAWIMLDPKNPLPHVVQGDTWIRAPDYEKATAAFRRALELEPDYFDAQVKLGSSLRELGRLDEATQLLRQCHKDQPNDPAAVLLLAQCESESGDVPAARSLLEGLLGEYPDLPAAQIELGKIELEDGEFEQAANLLRRAVKLEPQNDSALYNLATALKRLDRNEEAAESLARWSEIQESRRRLRDLLDRIEADPTDIEAHAQASAVCLDLGDPQQAARHLTAALARDPSHATARETLNRLKEHLPDFVATPRPTLPQESRP